MNDDDVRAVEIEMGRFALRLEEFILARLPKDLKSPKRSAMIRASLDLTKALARMRRPE